MIWYLLTAVLTFLVTYLLVGPSDLGTKLNKLYRMYHGEQVTMICFNGEAKLFAVMPFGYDYVTLKAKKDDSIGLRTKVYLDDVQDHPTIGLFVLHMHKKEVDEE